MSPALMTALFATLGLALAAVSAACVVLWRRVDALSRAPRVAPPVDLRGFAGEPPSRPKYAYEAERTLDELAGRHRALEARLARVEASATEAASAMIAAHPGGPRPARRVDRGAPATLGGPTLIAVPNLALAPASAPGSELANELDRRFGAVWALADSGVPAETVARETGYPVGQVELILGLRRRLPATGAPADA